MAVLLGLLNVEVAACGIDILKGALHLRIPNSNLWQFVLQLHPDQNCSH